MSEPKRLTDERDIKVGEAVTYEIPWWWYIGRVWRRGERYVAGTYVRPTRPSGFEFECTVAGQTGAREPDWINVVGQVTISGSAQFICRAIGNNALDTISASTWPAVSGVTIANEQTDAVKQLTSARLEMSARGQMAEVLNPIQTVSGEKYIFTLKLTCI